MEPDTSAGGGEAAAQADRAARIAALQASRNRSAATSRSNTPGSRKHRHAAHRARVVTGVVSTAAVFGLAGAMAVSAASKSASQTTAAALASTPATSSTGTPQASTTTTQKASSPTASAPSSRANTSTHGS